MNTNTFPLPSVAVPIRADEILEVLGDQFTLKLSGEQTGGAFMLGEIVTPPGGGPPPHVHDREDEIFLIRNGRMRILCDGRWTEAGPGDTLMAPRGKIHTYHNHTTEPCRFWMIATPAGFEHFIRELAAACSQTPNPETVEVSRICEMHGIHLVG